MSYPTFSPPREVSEQTELKVAPRVHETGFGDGYGQCAAAGLNNQLHNGTLIWTNLTWAQAEDIAAFMRARGGVEPFWWKPPWESAARLWRAKSYGFSFKNPYRTYEVAVEERAA